MHSQFVLVMPVAPLKRALFPFAPMNRPGRKRYDVKMRPPGLFALLFYRDIPKPRHFSFRVMRQNVPETRDIRNIRSKG